MNLIFLDNILINDLNDLTSVKLCDFGFSQNYSVFEKGLRSKAVGSLKYMAPEQDGKTKYDKVSGLIIDHIKLTMF